ncbi:DUF2975 domain-containing protein [Fodinibius halophilus]|uniref:DUF2975 domain-containing protein n=1 Tax=Fodinibius halophilus TaxID=1736908 RepID=A0A6M1SU68_9BACT|nr:DUF2975 domain-containing protein [Fodinibius halophilus]NGP87498.1 DUF2975 domain-containing protein [Fodinibius halophilus]
MKGLGEKSTAYFCYLIVNVWWYLSCLMGILFAGLLSYEFFGSSHPNSIFGLTLPIKSDLITLKNPEQYEYLSTGPAKGMIDFDYILQHTPYAYITWAIFIAIAIALFLLGLYQLRNLLKSATNNTIFTGENVRRLKIIALLVFLVEPLEWLAYYLTIHFLGPASEIIAHGIGEFKLEMPLIGSDWTFLIGGLLLYTLAAVFEKGNEMYQELKLTV